MGEGEQMRKGRKWGMEDYFPLVPPIPPFLLFRLARVRLVAQFEGDVAGDGAYVQGSRAGA
jgi:hypothetical protein